MYRAVVEDYNDLLKVVLERGLPQNFEEEFPEDFVRRRTNHQFEPENLVASHSNYSSHLLLPLSSCFPLSNCEKLSLEFVTKRLSIKATDRGLIDEENQGSSGKSSGKLLQKGSMPLFLPKVVAPLVEQMSSLVHYFFRF